MSQSILNTSSELINASVLVDNTTLLKALGVLRSFYKYTIQKLSLYCNYCKLLINVKM